MTATKQKKKICIIFPNNKNKESNHTIRENPFTTKEDFKREEKKGSKI